MSTAESFNCHTIRHWGYFCLQPEQGQHSTRTSNKTTTSSKQRQQPCGRQRKHVGDITTTNNYDPEEYSDQDGFETDEDNMISIDVADVTHQAYQRKEVFTNINVYQLPERPSDRTKRIINMKVDTGAMGNTLPLGNFHQMMPEKLDSDGLPNKDANRAKNTALLAYNKTPIKC